MAPRLGGEDEPPSEYNETEPIIENLADRKGHSLREWVLLDPPNREIFRIFKLFLKTFIVNNVRWRGGHRGRAWDA